MPPVLAFLITIPEAIGLFAVHIGTVLGITLGESIGLGAAVIVNQVSKLLTKKPSASSSSTLDNRSLTVNQSIAPRQVIYGRAGRIGGVFTFIDVTGPSSEFIQLVVTFTGHQVQSFDTVYFDGVALTLDGSGNATGKYAGFVHVEFNLGSDTQAAFPGLVTADPTKWTSDHRQRGCAGIYVQLKFNSTLFPSGVPNITADVHGKNDIFDPRTSSTGYSENAALCMRDYLLNSRWGLAATSGEIDDVQTQAAANVCDEAVALAAGGTEPRYALNGAFTTDVLPSDTMQSMLTAMCGRLVYVGGKFGIYPAAYATPNPIPLTDSEVSGPVEVQTSVQKTDLFNGVKGVYISPDSAWAATDFPPVQNSTYVTDDNGEVLWKDVQLPFTISTATAQRLAKIDLERARRQTQVSLQCKLTAYRVQVLDVIQLSIARYGWVNKTFEVLDLKFAVQGSGTSMTLGVSLTLQETDSNVFDWSTAEEQPANTAGALSLPGALPIPHTTVPFTITGKPGDAQTYNLITFTRDTHFLSDFAGSTASVVTNPTSPTVIFTVELSNVGTIAIGELHIHSDGSFSFFTNDLNSDGDDDDIWCSPGDTLQVVAPSPQDATLADITIAFNGDV